MATIDTQTTDPFPDMAPLENHPGVSKVQFLDTQPASHNNIISWEAANSPYRLPSDYKAFLLISNGLQLQWRVPMDGDHLPIGCMKLNRIDQVKRIQVEKNDLLIDSAGPPGKASDEASIPAAFELCGMDGRVDKPQIWFQDLSCTWHFISNTFTDYFRLMVAHLGLPRWLYVFTETGLDPAAKQWFRFLTPERLAADLESARARYSKDERPAVNVARSEKEKSGRGNKLNWSQIEKTSSKPQPSKSGKSGKKKKDEDLKSTTRERGGSHSSGFGALQPGRRGSGSGRPGSAGRARPSSAK